MALEPLGRMGERRIVRASVRLKTHDHQAPSTVEGAQK